MYRVFSVQNRPCPACGEGFVVVGRFLDRAEPAGVLDQALLDLGMAVANHVHRDTGPGHLDDRQGIALEVREDPQAAAGKPAADLRQDRRVNEARREISSISPVDVDPIAVSIEEHADQVAARLQGLEARRDHGLLDRIGVAQGKRAVGREMQGLQLGPARSKASIISRPAAPKR